LQQPTSRWQDHPETRRFGAAPARLPEWLRKNLSSGHQAAHTDKLISELGLHTICESGRCPNRNECYSQKTASFMILGDRCTRNCHYCSVAPGKPLPPDPNEPENLAEAVQRLGLKHAVITSVTRDDLEDEGLEHFRLVTEALRRKNPELILEILTPDFKRDQERAVSALALLPIDIFNHNIETVRAVHRRVRPQGGYDLSLRLLSRMRLRLPDRVTKSGAMLGLGETRDEVIQMLSDLRAAGCRMLTLGQYLQPDKTACPVERFVTPQEFADYKTLAEQMGFELVESGPFVRSSYHAQDSFIKLSRLIPSHREARSA
jgi:lipoic acid synthetase